MADRINDFRVIKRLGKGAFGDVFKVQRKSDNQFYALKKVSIASMPTREVQDALNEIRFLASVRHPNIIGFYEAFLLERSLELCIVMELAEGGDLAGKIEEHKKVKKYMDEKQIWFYFIQLVDGLKDFHDKKILHRDLKSANCFLALDGKLKIGDLNVSKLAKGGLVKTQIGTPYYMSPEIWRGRSYDSKSDMWAVGVILYEMAALRPPFRGVDIEDLSRRVQAGYYPRIPTVYSKELDEMIRLLLSMDPKRRPSADDLLAKSIVKEWREKLRSQMDETLKGDLGALNFGGGDLLGTIAVPQNKRQIQAKLPKACYPDARPHSPQAWPGNRAAVDAIKRLQTPVKEERGPAPSSAPQIRSSRRGSRDVPQPRSRSAAKRDNAMVDVRRQARRELEEHKPSPLPPRAYQRRIGAVQYKPQPAAYRQALASARSRDSSNSRASRDSRQQYAGAGNARQAGRVPAGHPQQAHAGGGIAQRRGRALPALGEHQQHQSPQLPLGMGIGLPSPYQRKQHPGSVRGAASRAQHGSARSRPGARVPSSRGTQYSTPGWWG